MSENILQWVGTRHQEALRRVRLWGLVLALSLCGAAGWLGWREAGLAGLAGRTQAALGKEAAAETLLRLKLFAHAAFLAKLRGNCLLMDITGYTSEENICRDTGDMRGLPGTSACVQSWFDALETTWAAAFGQAGPPLPEGLRRDRWGSPYLLNLSENSCGLFGSWCPSDAIRSPGPDGKADTPDDIQAAIPQHLGPLRIQ